MQSASLIELAQVLGLSTLNERTCQRCLKLYNEDVDILENSSSVLGSECEDLVQSLNAIVTETTSSFCENYRSGYASSYHWDSSSSISFEKLSDAVDDSELMRSTKQLASYCLVMIIESTDAMVSFTAMEFLLKLCYLPGASAYGIGNINVFSVVCSKLFRFVMSEISGTPVGGVCAVRGPGRRPPEAPAAAEVDMNVDGDGSDDDSESELEDGDVPSRTQRRLRARSKVNYNETVSKANPATKVSELCPLFLSMLQLVSGPSSSSPLIKIFTQKNQLPNLEVFVDSLVVLAVTNSASPKFSKACVSAAELLLQTLTSHSSPVFVRVVKSLLPLLSCDSRDIRCLQLRSDQKTTKRDVGVCLHNAAVKLMCTYISTHVAFDVDGCDDSNGEVGNWDSVATAAVDDSSTFVCSVLGCLERVVLRCGNDARLKGTPRSNVLKSIKAMLATTVAHMRAAGVAAHFTHLGSFLRCLIKCSRASTPQARMFAVESIVCAVAPRGSWLWADPVAAEAINMKSMRLELFKAVLGRCTDSSPLVRHKSISVLQEFVVDQSAVAEDSVDSSDVEHSQFVYCLVSGEQYQPDFQSTEKEPVSALCLLDVLRELCMVAPGDAIKSALVRSKALQALSACLCQGYLYRSSGSGVVNPVSVHVSRDDVTLFIVACSNAPVATSSDIRSGSLGATAPASIVVKKQAVQSLTELIVFRPIDVELQDAWLTHVLPLIYDGENTVVTAVAKAGVELLFASLVAWFNGHNCCSNDASDSPSLLLCWSIYARMLELNRTLLVKTCIQQMVLLSLLPTSVGNAAVIDDVVSRVGMKEEVDLSIVSVLLALQAACNDEQYPTVDGACGTRSETAWVLLELLLTHNQVGGAAVTGTLGITDILNHLGKCHTNSSAFIVQCWYNKRGYNATTGMCSADKSIVSDNEICLLGILTKVSHNISVSDAKVVSAQLVDILSSLPSFGAKAAVSGSHVSKMVSALYVLTVRHAYADGLGPKKANSSITPVQQALLCIYNAVLLWVDKVAGICSDVLKVYGQTRCTKPTDVQFDTTKGTGRISDPYLLRTVKDFVDAHSGSAPAPAANGPDPTAKMNELVSVALLILGEIVMLGFTREEEEDNYHPLPGAAQGSGAASYVVSGVTQSVKFVLSSAVMATIKLVAMSSIDDGKAKAMALISLGKLCMRSKSTSRSCVNLFLREIQLPDSSTGSAAEECSTVATRTNSLLILSDMCVRYTNLIEPHIHTISASLQDADVMIRKNTFIMLIQLILQDYIKLKGQILNRLLLCTLDSDDEFHEFVKETLRSSVLTKYPNFVLQHFTETIVACSGCTSHPGYLSFNTGCSQDASSLLIGAAKQGQRFKIYAFLLSTLVSDEQKIHITAKVSHDILAWVVDNNQLCSSSSVSTALEQVVKDSFVVLQSPLLCVHSSSGATTEGIGVVDEDDGAHDAGSALLAKAKSKILVQVSKQHMVDTILPVLFSLKHVVEAAKSPLQRGLTEYLTYLYRSNPNEMDRALSAEPILKAELLYDIQLHETEVQKKKQLHKRLQQEHAAAMAEEAAARQQADLLEMQLGYLEEAPAVPGSTASGTPAPPRTPGTALSASRRKSGGRSSLGGGKLCPPSVKKLDSDMENDAGDGAQAASLSSSRRQSRTPNEMLKAVGSQLRVQTASPYAKSLSERRSISRPSTHLKYGPLSATLPDLEDSVDPTADGFDPMGGLQGNNFSTLSRTTTRRLSWTVTVDHLDAGDDLSPGSPEVRVTVKSPPPPRSASKRGRGDAMATTGSPDDGEVAIAIPTKRSRMGMYSQTGNILETMRSSSAENTAAVAPSTQPEVSGRRRRVGTNSLASMVQ